jgi:hypothetical protein
MEAIKVRIAKISDIVPVVRELFGEEFHLSEEKSDFILEKNLKPYIESLNSELYVVIESPYVDKVYRDSYYIYYSSKLSKHYRDTIRVSLFSCDITDADFRNITIVNNKLLKSYLGFFIIRPTFPKIIGRSAISPKAKKESDFLCCLSHIEATVNGVKFQVAGFPHASQDSQTITCAETTIWAMLEYFGTKYPEYKPVLPSTISRHINKMSYKRIFPSDGLTAEQVTYTVRELGFGSMIYSRRKYNSEFLGIVNTYIESGIPVIGVLKNKSGTIGHAVNIIGRELEELDLVLNSASSEKTEFGGEIIDYNGVIKRKYVFMDDNHPPYQLASLDFPCQDYYKDTEDTMEDVDLTHIIVPLYSKVYLDAVKARRNFSKFLSSKTLNEEVEIGFTDKRIVKTFLCSSRSYKEYLSLNNDVVLAAKEIILATPMPKFIWVAEISTVDSYKSGKCNSFLIQDATEPYELSDKTSVNYHSIFVGLLEKYIFRQDFGSFTKYSIFAPPFEPFKGNLKKA